MESKRLKNIVILILALLNVFLLVLLFSFRWQRSAAQQHLTEQLYALYETSEVSLPEEKVLSLGEAAPSSLSLQRDLAHEAAIAAYLLGEEAEGEHQGGGIYTYTAAGNTVYFRSNGAFDYVPASHAVSSPREFCEAYCETFGYRQTGSTLTGSGGSFTACRIVEDTPVYNCTVSFLFEAGSLVSLSGSCLSTVDSSTSGESLFSATDALVKFLDHRRLSGAVCNAVIAVQSVYEYHTAAQAPVLSAKWQISTDTYQYYVDCSTGAVTRE